MFIRTFSLCYGVLRAACDPILDFILNETPTVPHFVKSESREIVLNRLQFYKNVNSYNKYNETFPLRKILIHATQDYYSKNWAWAGKLNNKKI